MGGGKHESIKQKNCPGDVLNNFEKPVFGKRRNKAPFKMLDNIAKGSYCAQACNDVGGDCAAFTYRGSTQQCRLFNSDGSLSDAADETLAYYPRVQTCRTDTL